MLVFRIFYIYIYIYNLAINKPIQMQFALYFDNLIIICYNIMVKELKKKKTKSYIAICDE